MNIVIDIQCCRTCLKSTTDNYLLSQKELLQKIETVTSLVIKKSDGFPLYFCSSCYKKLEQAYQFRQQSLKARNALQEYISKVKHQFNEIFEHKAILEENIKESKSDTNDESHDLYEYETIETVTLKNPPRISNSDITKNEDEQDLNYAVHNIDQISKSLIEKDETEEHRLEEDLNERIKNIVYENKYSTDLEVAEVEFGSKQLVKCEKCEKVFKKENLVRHMAAHTGESRFKCNICQKNFTQKTGLNRHILIHNGERPYKCKNCGKKFSQAKSLKFHMALHGQSDTYNCTICRYKFIKPENLEIHMKEKHSSKSEPTPTYVCEYCKKSFKLNYTLNAHIKKYHENEALFSLTFEEELKESESE